MGINSPIVVSRHSGNLVPGRHTGQSNPDLYGRKKPIRIFGKLHDFLADMTAISAMANTPFNR